MSIIASIRKHFGRIVLVALLLVLAGLLVWLTVNVRSLYRQGIRPSHGFRRYYLTQPFTPAEIQNWMPFVYVNHIFNLPPDYLATTLKIQDSRYPHLTIQEYEENNKLNDAEFLKQVSTAVSQYLQAAH